MAPTIPGLTQEEILRIMGNPDQDPNRVFAKATSAPVPSAVAAPVATASTIKPVGAETPAPTSQPTPTANALAGQQAQPNAFAGQQPNALAKLQNEEMKELEANKYRDIHHWGLKPTDINPHTGKPYGEDINPETGQAFTGNHPGFLGKLGHIAAKVGNIAGDVAEPLVMANVPGTEMYNRVHENRLKGNIEEIGAIEAKQKAALAQKAQKIQIRDPEDPTNNVWGNYDPINDQVTYNGKVVENPQVGAASAEQQAAEYGRVLAAEAAAATGGPALTAAQQAAKTNYEAAFPKQAMLTQGYRQMDDLRKKIDNTNTSPQRRMEFQAQLAETAQRIIDTDPAAAGRLDIQRETAGLKPVQAVNNESGQLEVVPRATYEADQKSGKPVYSKATEISSAELQNDNRAVNTINDMQVKLDHLREDNEHITTDDRNTLKQILSLPMPDVDMSQGLDTIVRALYSWGTQVLSTKEAQGLSESGKQYLIDVLSMRESGMALPKLLTGGSRVTEIQTSALWATLPGAMYDAPYVSKQIERFQENLDRLQRGVAVPQGNRWDRFPTANSVKGAGAGTENDAVAGFKKDHPDATWVHTDANGKPDGWRKVNDPEGKMRPIK